MRAAPVGFGVTDRLTVPFPVPEEPDVMLSQARDSDAVHEHVDADGVTVMLYAPPATIGLTGFGLTEYVQATGALCVTVNVFPAIVTVPVRGDAAVFCVHVTVVEPDPEPLPGDTLSHDALSVAVQLDGLHPAGVAVTVTACEPAAYVGLALV